MPDTRPVGALTAITLAAALAAVPAAAADRVVNMYNWSDYIDEELLEKSTSYADMAGLQALEEEIGRAAS